MQFSCSNRLLRRRHPPIRRHHCLVLRSSNSHRPNETPAFPRRLAYRFVHRALANSICVSSFVWLPRCSPEAAFATCPRPERRLERRPTPRRSVMALFPESGAVRREFGGSDSRDATSRIATSAPWQLLGRTPHTVVTLNLRRGRPRPTSPINGPLDASRSWRFRFPSGGRADLTRESSRDRIRTGVSKKKLVARPSACRANSVLKRSGNVSPIRTRKVSHKSRNEFRKSLQMLTEGR